MTRAPLSSGPGVLDSAASFAPKKKWKKQISTSPEDGQMECAGWVVAHSKQMSVEWHCVRSSRFIHGCLTFCWFLVDDAPFTALILQTLARPFCSFQPAWTWRRASNLGLVTLGRPSCSSEFPSVFSWRSPHVIQSWHEKKKKKLILLLDVHVEEVAEKLWSCFGRVFMSKKKKSSKVAANLTLVW